MPERRHSRNKLRRLQWMLGLLFIGLALPGALLIGQGFAQIELAEFRRQQLIAEDLIRSIDARLIADIAIENARPASDFEYAVSTSDADNIVQLSPLSSLAAASSFPGTIGYFQVDASGQLSTPLLPATGIEAVPADERRFKIDVETELADVLEANRLVGFRRSFLPDDEQPEESRQELPESAAVEAASFETAADAVDESESGEAPARSLEAPASNLELRGQAVFDELAAANEPQPARFEDDRDREAASAVGDSDSARPVVRVSTFTAELEPLRFNTLETGHFVLFRNAWRDGERFVQGLLIDRSEFILEAFERTFVNAGLASGTQLTVSSGDDPIATVRAEGEPAVDAPPLYDARLSPPLAEIEFKVAAGTLGRGPGFSLLAWTSLALIGVLIGGFAAMYRFGYQQIQLARQQQNFVSAVSHELKTPLTSIRMYGEMLKSGWADDDRKQVYYDYIFDEGERLSRLIDNVLHLAKLNRGEPAVSMEQVTVGELLDVMRSKLATQTDSAGFELEFVADPAINEVVISADIDALTQVFINLVDNAIKFSGESAERRIRISARGRDNRSVIFAVRDFGPGISPSDMKRLFDLFYRPDNELTRATAGTGIGLALVRQLVTAMAGRVDVRNADPGAEFWLVFPRVGKA